MIHILYINSTIYPILQKSQLLLQTTQTLDFPNSIYNESKTIRKATCFVVTRSFTLYSDHQTTECSTQISYLIYKSHYDSQFTYFLRLVLFEVC